MFAETQNLVLIHEDILVISITGNAKMQKVISDHFSPFSHVFGNIKCSHWSRMLLYKLVQVYVNPKIGDINEDFEVVCVVTHSSIELGVSYVRWLWALPTPRIIWLLDK